ncbi:type II toxin-antitoxin system VapC family toxin [Caenimonas aquaedulcis]|uniref:Ribonuclease VapC n=1 Tax=Caenimonas aquaedulcis TaxID=2793270 RepID=A0A931MFH3_9BURK|nr:type II toxin-antitoxin system VapC family toxin [Caenimonas aquaedulcis]MBG9387288.1 type II toxin-antitoxin system VapC family toxin [Caenimonas aquaedulcis]
MAARWLLDTCVVSELAKPVPDARLREWLSAHVNGCRLAAVTLGEIAFGIESLPHGARRNGLQRWAGELQQRFSSRTLVTDEPVWTTFGRLKASLRMIGRPQDDLDILMAATATVHGLGLVTRNTRHFSDTGVALINPWEPAH